MEKSNYEPDKIKEQLATSFSRESDLSPRVCAFFRKLLLDDKIYDRE